MAQCMYCQGEIAEGSSFCNHCGKKQVKVYTQTFRREGLSEDVFIQKINEWFQAYPQVANVKGKFLLSSHVGMFVNKYRMDALAIEYEVLNGHNTNQYAVVSLSKTGLIKLETDRVLAQWQQNNPGATVINTSGGVHQRGDSGSLIIGGFGAVNKTQLYVLFKYDRNKGTGIA